jgi:hypothetical protein
VNLNLVHLKIMGKLVGCDLQCINLLHDMKVPSLGITQHYAGEVDRVLDLAIGIRLPLFDDDCHTNHVACSRYVKLQVFVGFRGH